MTSRILKGSLPLIFLSGFAGPACAISLHFSPSAPTVQVGDTVSTHLSISGLGAGAAPSLGAFDLTVGLDNTILAYHSAAFGDPMLGNQLAIAMPFSEQDTATTANTVQMAELSYDDATVLDTYQLENFVLATLTFEALAPGVSPLTYLQVVLADAEGAPLSATVTAGSITVVPLPASIWLFVTALAALFGRKGIAASNHQLRSAVRFVMSVFSSGNSTAYARRIA